MSARPREVPRPSFTLAGRSNLAVLVFPASGIALAPIAALGVFVTLSASPAGPLPPGTLVVLAIALFGALGFAADRWARRRCNDAEVFADRVLVRDPVYMGLRPVFLAEVTSFDDASSDHVTLLVEGGAPAYVATLDEELRTRLLQVLVDACVPRRDSPREVAVAPVELVAVRRPIGRGERATPVAVVAVLAFSYAAAIRAPGFGWFAGVGEPIVLGFLLLGPLSLPVLVQWALWRLRRVRLHADRLVLSRRITIAWDDVVGWRDLGPGGVRVVVRSGLPSWIFSPTRTIPTPTADVFRAVEALLTERGIPRLP